MEHYLLNNIFPGVLIAIITSFVTVWLSIKRFRSERWWERKADTYSKLITSIHQMIACCENHEEYIESGAEDSNAEKRFEHAFFVVKKQMQNTLEAGSFFMSCDAEKVFQNLKKDLDEAKKYQPGFDEYFTYIFESLKQGLSEIQRLAKKDLKIR